MPTPDIDRMSADELREYIAQRIREIQYPELLWELIDLMAELIEKGGDTGSTQEPPDAAQSA